MPAEAEVFMKKSKIFEFVSSVKRLIFGCLFLCVLFTGCKKEENMLETMSFSQEEGSLETESRTSFVYVHVCGCVVNPGVYELSEGSRVFEAIEAAGGFTEEAAEDSLNLAAVLSDGDQIRIPDKEEAEEMALAPSVSDGMVNINTAGLSELMTLPGVGESRAQTILSYRETNGPFEAPEDLMKIPGIKSAVFEKMKSKVTTGR